MTRRTKHSPSAADPRRAVAYLRVSTDRQDLGPEAQRAAITAWATREGVTIAAWHEDRGSGAAAIADRPALLAALADLRTCTAGVLAVAKRDRLARDVMAAAMIDRLTLDAGARVVSAAGEGTDGTDPAAMLLTRMIDAFAEYERAVIASRTRAALGVKRARGEATSHAPYGYRTAEDGRLVPSATEQAVIALVRKARGEGFTVREITAQLEAKGVVSRRGKPLAVAAVGELVVRHAS